MDSFSEIFNVLIFGYPVSFDFIDNSYPVFLQKSGGLILTIIITICSSLIGLLIGLLLSLLNNFKIHIKHNYSIQLLNKPIVLLIELIKSMPIMILVLLFYYLPYPIFKIRIPAIFLAISAFSLYAAVYYYEIIQSGFKSISYELINSTKVLGLSYYQTFLYVKLPISLKIMIPALLGVIITIFKDTSVLVVVGVAELTFTARQLSVSSPGRYALVLLMIIGIYWVIATSFTILIQRLEISNNIKGWGGQL